MIKRPSLIIVIVNWNSGIQLQACLKSIETARRMSFDIVRVVVVDNASTDSSISDTEMRGNWIIPIRIIRNKTNLGFAKACNQGAETETADYILFLNPDVQLSEYALEIPVGFLEKPEAKQYGLAGIRLIDQTGRVQRTCARLPTAMDLAIYSLGLDRIFPSYYKSHLMSEWPHDGNRDVGHCIGAFYLVRQKVFFDLGAFDERFFVYQEDLDFSKRLSEAGYLTRFIAETWSYHKGGGTTEAIRGKRLYFSLYSRLQYIWKHYDSCTSALLSILLLIVEPFLRLFYQICRGKSSQTKDVIDAYGMVWLSLAGIKIKATRT